MAFSNSLSAKIYLNGWNLTCYFKSVSANGQVATADTTVLCDTFMSFITGQKSGNLTLSGLYDGAEDADFDILNAAFGADKVFLFFPQGDTHGNIGVGLSGFTTSLEIPAEISSAVMLNAEIQSNTGFDFGKSLHALSAETSAGNGTSLDNAAATTNGATAYLLVTDFDGTDATIKVQDSADNSSFADIITFTQITADNQAERKAITGNVRRYTRMNLSGTFTSITFVLLLCRK